MEDLMCTHTDRPSWSTVHTCHLSWDDWLVYERDMNDQEDYKRWIMEMEGEASAAVTHGADLNTSNTPS